MTSGLTLALLLATGAPVHDTPKLGPFDGFQRGVHVFTNYIVDLGWGVQYLDMALSGHTSGMRQMSNGWPPSAEICNTPEFYCIQSSDPKAAMQLAVPRRCRPLRVGEVFVAGGRRTVVLEAMAGVPAPLVDHPSVDSYLLADQNRPDVVLVYRGPQGVTGFFQANAPAYDLREAAKRGALDRAPPMVGGYPAWLTFSISTPDTFAACEGSGYLLRRG